MLARRNIYAWMVIFITTIALRAWAQEPAQNDQQNVVGQQQSGRSDMPGMQMPHDQH